MKSIGKELHRRGVRDAALTRVDHCFANGQEALQAHAVLGLGDLLQARPGEPATTDDVAVRAVLLEEVGRLLGRSIAGREPSTAITT
jgi:hypothetical protein